jgi:hypothetical protein
MRSKLKMSAKVKQRGGGSSECPPGVLCLSNGVLLLLLAVAVLICGVFIYFAFQNQKSQAVTIKMEMPNQREPRVMRDMSATNLPSEPVRRNGSQPDFDTAGSVFNVPTQGYAEKFQQVGLLVAQGGSPLSANPERSLVPLYGRRISARRDKWNYYTRTDGLNPVQVPIKYKNRDCDDDNGCDEVYNGDDVSVPTLGQSFKVNVYKQKNLVYNPFA